ncbi:MAG TPA: biotin/lipoyl-binding carrier protein [Nocardioides sp.]|nr:biotin/lipoyl-binding carrier protein [Nocardioides sp.]
MSVAQVAPIVASVWKIEVAVGDRVEAGATLAVVESMKMEIPILASVTGVVESIPVEPGQIVQEGDAVVVIAPDTGVPEPRAAH